MRNRLLTALLVGAFLLALPAAAPGKDPIEGSFLHHVFFWLNEPDNPAARQDFLTSIRKMQAIPSIKYSYIGTPAGTRRDVVDNSWTFIGWSPSMIARAMKPTTSTPCTMSSGRKRAYGRKYWCTIPPASRSGVTRRKALHPGPVKIPSYIAYPFAAAAACGVLQVIANRQIFHPMKYPGGWWERQAELGAEDVWFPASDGVRLHGWWSAAEGPFVTLFLHGNAGNVSHRGSHLSAVDAAGSSILIVDYRGYGRSEGRPGEKGFYADAEGAYEYLRRRGYAPERIIVHGESLGTSVAVALALRKPVAGVVLEAPFTAAGDIAHRVVPFLGPLLVRAFPTRRWIGQLTVPLLIIHGDADEVIPYSMGQELFAAAPEPKRFWRIPGGGHSDIVEAGGAAYVELLREFYRSIESRA